MIHLRIVSSTRWRSPDACSCWFWFYSPFILLFPVDWDLIAHLQLCVPRLSLFWSLSCSQLSLSSNHLPWQQRLPFMATVPSIPLVYLHWGSQTPGGPAHLRHFETGLERIQRTFASKLLNFTGVADKSRLKAKLLKWFFIWVWWIKFFKYQLVKNLH